MPEYLPGPTEITARDGDRAVLPCTIQNLGTKQVAWKRIDEEHFVSVGGIMWERDDAISMETKQDELTDLTHWDLVFDPVRADHAGIYECQISAKHKQNRHFTLRVVGPPVRKAPNPGLVLKGEMYVELGQRILLTCTVHTGPHVHQDIDWFKDGDKLVSNTKQGVIITKYNSAVSNSLVSELIVDHSRASDTGTYICRSATDDIKSLKVTVLNFTLSNMKLIKTCRTARVARLQAANRDCESVTCGANTTNVKREHDSDSSENFNLPMSKYDGKSGASRRWQHQSFVTSVVSFIVLTLILRRVMCGV